MSSPAPDPLTRLVELTVYAPIGLAAAARDRLPELVAEGRSIVEQRLTVARFVGQMVVAQGRREIERRLAADRDSDRSATDTATAAASDDDDREAAAPGTEDRDPPPPADALPLEDYESLAASQVVARLADLEPAGLDMVERFERAHRNRRTVLNRIAQLR